MTIEHQEQVALDDGRTAFVAIDEHEASGSLTVRLAKDTLRRSETPDVVAQALRQLAARLVGPGRRVIRAVRWHLLEGGFEVEDASGDFVHVFMPDYLLVELGRRLQHRAAMDGWPAAMTENRIR